MTKLDLHGVKHSEVGRMVENFVYLNQYQMPLTVVCGNSNKMIELAMNTIKHIGCKTHSPQYGTIIIRDFS